MWQMIRIRDVSRARVLLEAFLRHDAGTAQCSGVRHLCGDTGSGRLYEASPISAATGAAIDLG